MNAFYTSRNPYPVIIKNGQQTVSLKEGAIPWLLLVFQSYALMLSAGLLRDLNWLSNVQAGAPEAEYGEPYVLLHHCDLQGRWPSSTPGSTRCTTTTPLELSVLSILGSLEYILPVLCFLTTCRFSKSAKSGGISIYSLSEENHTSIYFMKFQFPDSHGQNMEVI